jgi:hypothetical protein
MVRRGSTVRVRQRASLKDLLIRVFVFYGVNDLAAAGTQAVHPSLGLSLKQAFS